MGLRFWFEVTSNWRGSKRNSGDLSSTVGTHTRQDTKTVRSEDDGRAMAEYGLLGELYVRVARLSLVAEAGQQPSSCKLVKLRQEHLFRSSVT